MTHAERAAIEAAVPSARLSWRPVADPRFVALSAGPCPLLEDTGRCGVYAVRPMNCRRFQCGRDGDEAWDEQILPLRLISDRPFRRQYAVNQREAQRWGLKHGWPS